MDEEVAKVTGKVEISASLEDYLEAIYHTEEAKGAARAKDIVLALGVHNSSVTQALRALAEKDLINYAPYEVITLTAPGRRVALDVVKRHQVLSKFLVKVLGLPADRADEGACRMEHSIDGMILDRLVKFVEYFEQCPLNDVMWDDAAGFFCGKGLEDGTCGRDSCGGPQGLAGPGADENESR
ncbi:metal-dependent transcriptional regulator [bacterium]|nr:metal-dependent transcriptional regulator [bacterium]